MASRNFLGMLLAEAISVASASCPGCIWDMCTRALSPYLPLAVSIETKFQLQRLPRLYVLASYSTSDRYCQTYQAIGPQRPDDPGFLPASRVPQSCDCGNPFP